MQSCQKLVATKKRWKRFTSALSADDVKIQILELKSQVMGVQIQFLVSPVNAVVSDAQLTALKVHNVANLSITQIKSTDNLQDRLDSIERNIVGRINAASENNEEAKKLFGISEMNEEEKARSLQKSELVGYLARG